MEESQLFVGAATDAGTVRDTNEDRVHHERLPATSPDAPEAYLLAVADGMGGYERGEIASKMAIDILHERVQTLDTDDASLILKQAYRRANERIHEDGSAQGEENMMGTTLVSGLVVGNDITIANVGDSRAYLLRAGALTQVTEDHSLIAEQVRMGVITAEEARTANHKNIITRALGHRPRVDVDIYELTLLPEDRLLLSTDGVHDFLEEDEMRALLADHDPDDAAQSLVESALERGSNDNVTALCVWMAPVEALVETVEEGVADRRSSMLVPVLVGVALVIVILIIAVLLFL
ncbi:MAG: Stp1/IreP family PP2C-type Ser/Thr phosphatase [Chloroflexota bacterium]